MKLYLHYEGDRREEVERTWPDVHAEQERREQEFSDGDRVKLVALAQNVNGYDDRPNLPPGSLGTVSAMADGSVTDGGGSLLVHWDNGSRLMATVDDVVERLTPRR